MKQKTQKVLEKKSDISKRHSKILPPSQNLASVEPKPLEKENKGISETDQQQTLCSCGQPATCLIRVHLKPSGVCETCFNRIRLKRELAKKKKQEKLNQLSNLK